ncbi:hypothetical protein [Halobacillus naozhouensis]|uniref:BclA C-terminal domain-containing protein n=1 Tax=Halobacillus naozhouensis TaxID=554880 RepID=A0ABY8J1N6_9BACI|nr:hypothetical protein [Halobacillus naozhouensis]WFT76413.1 hypothetical protein P9989_08635 [Halobacillus naozhouensis]
MCAQLPLNHQPVYGSLYGFPGILIEPVNSVPIEFATAGPTSGMDADPASNSITVMSSGLYEIHFSLTDRVSKSNDFYLRYSIAVNGTQQLISSIYFSNSTASTVYFNGSKTILLSLNPDDTITVLPNGMIGNNHYLNAVLLVKKIR